MPSALRSALEQDFDDYEVVVVANDCQDATRDVVESFDDPRLRYFETDRLLTKPENWDFAWTKARGRYLTCLPDDDALVPSALRQVADHALHGSPPIISWEDAPYYYPDWNDEQMQNRMLLVFAGTKLVEDIPVSFYRLQCARFEFAWNSPLPKFLNCVANREFFDDWRRRSGHLFLPAAPDYAFAWVATHVCQYIRVLHRPLSVRGISDNSIGSNGGLGTAAKKFHEEFGDFDFVGEAPLTIPTSLNLVAGTFLRVSHALMAQGVTPEPVDHAAFMVAAARQLKETPALLRGWPELAEELVDAAARVSPKVRETVERVLLGPTEASRSERVQRLRERTAVVAADYAGDFASAADDYMGNEPCARCALGLKKGVLAEPKWGYAYISGDEVGASDPHAMGRHVDAHYDMMLECRRLQRLAENAQPFARRSEDDIANRLFGLLLHRLPNKVVLDVGCHEEAFVRRCVEADADFIFAVECDQDEVGQLRRQFANVPSVRVLGDSGWAEWSLGSLVARGSVPRRVGVLRIGDGLNAAGLLEHRQGLEASIVMLNSVDVSTPRLPELADSLRGAGFATVAVVKRDGNVERIQINDTTLRAGEWGEAFFVHDSVVDGVSEVIFVGAARTQSRLVERLQLLQSTNSNGEAHVAQPPEDAGAAEALQLVEDTLPAVAEMVRQQSRVLDQIQVRLEESAFNYERARAQLEAEWSMRVEAAERRIADAEASAQARLEVIAQLQGALDRYRFWSLGERLHRSWSPKLGVLYQHAPRQLRIPAWYRDTRKLADGAPQISIVTPSFNQGQFIERTLKSVLDQQYPHLQYIVQDALSSDGTPQVLERYASSLARVDSRPDTGFANGINVGFSHATGEIMAYLNSDDLLLPGAANYVAEYFMSHPEIDVIYGHRVVIDEYDAEIGRWVLPAHRDAVLSWADYVPQETLFWRRSIWEKAGGAIDESFRFAIDWDLLLRFRDSGACMHRVPRFLGAFRVHPHQKTSSSMQELGLSEMNRLRERCHGRSVTAGEIDDALAGYLRSHIIYHKLYRLGVLRY